MHNREASVSRQSSALAQTTKSNETKTIYSYTPERLKHRRQERELAWPRKQTQPWFVMPFATSSQQMERALFLQTAERASGIYVTAKSEHTLLSETETDAHQSKGLQPKCIIF